MSDRDYNGHDQQWNLVGDELQYTDDETYEGGNHRFRQEYSSEEEESVEEQDSVLNIASMVNLCQTHGGKFDSDCTARRSGPS